MTPATVAGFPLLKTANLKLPEPLQSVFEVRSKYTRPQILFLDFWIRSNHPGPSVLRHDCFSQVEGTLSSSVRTSVGSSGHHYLLSGCLFPKGK